MSDHFNPEDYKTNNLEKNIMIWTLAKNNCVVDNK